MAVKKIAVTGSQGFLGSEIVRQLKCAGHEIFEFSHSKMNYFDVGNLTRSLKGVEILIHAAWTGVTREERNNKQVQEKNVVVAMNLIEACKNAEVTHVVGLGSQAEFGNQPAPFNDEQIAVPSTQYGMAKCAVHKLLQNSEFKLTWARIFSAYGENDSRDWIFTRAISAINKREVLTVGSCSQLWSLTHKYDIALGVEWIINKEIFGTVNLSTIETETLRSYLEKLQKLAGYSDLINFSQDINTNYDNYPSAGRLYGSGWRPKISINEGFVRCLDRPGKTI